MSSNNRNHHTTGGQPHASYTRKSTVASAIPSTHTAVTTAVLSATASTVSGSDATTAAAPAKRGRGRPRKNPVETSTTNDDEDNSSSASEDAPEVAPRKRGRPPKLNKVVQPPVVDPSVPKRGRGRPRKNPLPTDESATTGVSVSGSGSMSSRVAPSGLNGAGHHASTVEPPRKRGRPRKE